MLCRALREKRKQEQVPLPLLLTWTRAPALDWPRIWRATLHYDSCGLVRARVGCSAAAQGLRRVVATLARRRRRLACGTDNLNGPRAVRL